VLSGALRRSCGRNELYLRTENYIFKTQWLE
jgi:hypothetical protein